VHLRGEQGIPEPFERQSGFESEPTLPVQGSRESGHHQFRVREREPTLTVQGSRESRHGQSRVRERADHGLRRKPAGEAALVHRTG